MDLETVRSRVRLRLEDESASPLWSDDEIDEGVHQAIDEYSDFSLVHASTSVVADAGDTTLSLPSDVRRVVRVMSPRDQVIPRRQAPLRSTTQEELAWEMWGEELHFSRPLLAGEYRIRYLRARAMPAQDTDDLPVPEHHISLIVLGAALWCLERRGIEDWKRGPIQQRYTSILTRTRQDYNARWRAVRRSIRTSQVEISG